MPGCIVVVAGVGEMDCWLSDQVVVDCIVVVVGAGETDCWLSDRVVVDWLYVNSCLVGR